MKGAEVYTKSFLFFLITYLIILIIRFLSFINILVKTLIKIKEVKERLNIGCKEYHQYVRLTLKKDSRKYICR